MARVRGGNTGYALALVITGAGFVIALLVAIIAYTQIDAAKNESERAADNLAKYVTPGETSEANEYITPDGSVFAVMRVRIQKLENDNATLSGDVRKLEAAQAAKDSEFKSLTDIRNDLDKQLETERAQFLQMMNQRQQQVDALIAEKDGLVAQLGELQGKVTAAIGDADAAARDRIAELGRQVQQRDSEINAITQDMEELSRQLARCMAERPQAPIQNTTLPDGQVSSVFSGGSDMFINLGRSNGLVIGMNFEVFDPNPVIQLSDQGEARGKATIEVYALTDDSATCRVVRMDRGEQIDPGDPVVNIAYDPNKTYHIYAYGYFDIEGDSGPSDIARINGMITANGAKIPQLKLDDAGIPQLTPFVDYLVLGEPPVLPEAPDNAIDPEVIAEYQAKLAAHDAYFRLVDEAKLLRIPVLNQNRFLDLRGYYVR